MFFFSRRNESNRKYCFCRSVDGKAYIRPGTGEGMNHARNQRILQPTAEERSRKLPIHDWPERKMYITPSAHSIFSKIGETIDSTEKLITDDDYHFVFVRPKFFIGSSGTVWASETMNLRFMYPSIFEIPDNKHDYSSAFRSICAHLHDAIFLYDDMCEPRDICRSRPGIPDNPHTSYERQRLERLSARIDKALKVNNNECLEDGEKVILASRIEPLANKISVSLQDAKNFLADPNHDQSCTIASKIQNLQQRCKSLLEGLKELDLPAVRPRWCDLTDAGPGVAISNFEVKFRDAELSRIWNSDYRIRLHRAREDSGQGEAERTNSAVGDAVIDGGSIKWEYYDRFYDKSDEDIEKMTLAEYETHEDKRMERNAWRVAHDIALRIDDAPVLSEYIRGFVTEKDEETFFFNKNQLQDYIKASESSKENIPGSNYIAKICNYIKDHYDVGELYMEFVKDACKVKAEKQCAACASGWTGSQIDRIPRPFPDETTFRYKMIQFESPATSSDGKLRPIDDYMPRAQIKKFFSAGKLNTAQEVADFSSKFVVSEELVKKYVDHLKHINFTKELRTTAKADNRRNREAKCYKDYNWDELLLTGGLKFLHVFELDTYLKHHSLPWKKKLKTEKIRTITNHLQQTRGQVLQTMTVEGQRLLQPGQNVSDDEEETDGDDIDIVGETWSSDDERLCSSDGMVDSETEESDYEPVPPSAKRRMVSTRSGRKASSFVLGNE